MPNITIGGVEFPVSDVYEAGHEINAAEAATLNQTRRENLRNNFRKNVAKAKENGGLTEDTLATLQASFADMDSKYDFTGVRRGAGVSRDPVQTEARKIARIIVSEALKAKGIKKDSLAEGALEKKVDEVAAMEQVQAEAKKRVESLRSVASISLEGVGAA